MQRPEVPQKLGRYQVLARIGEGGMATVYLGRRMGPAIAEDDDQFVALKVIREEFSHREDFVRMFLDEVKIVSSIHNPGIVRLLEFGQEGKRLYCAIELVMGQSLWRVWDTCKLRKSRLRYDWIAYVGARIAEGLHAAHELGCIHRDVSPSNVLLSYDGRVKIIDFGTAKAQHRLSKTTIGVVKGKYAYMAPEQASGTNVDRRADIFSLGVTLWEISTDRRLFKRKDDVETLIAVNAAEIPDPCGIVWGYPRPLWRILRRALRKEPDKRYGNGLEMARELDEFAKSEARKPGQQEIADVMHALFPLEAEQDMGFMKDASASLETSGPMSARTSITRLSVDEIAPDDWKKALPAGVLNERTKKP